MHGWVHVRELKLVSWDLSIRGHVPLTQEKNELILGKLGVNLSERNHVEGQIPGGILHGQTDEQVDRVLDRRNRD